MNKARRKECDAIANRVTALNEKIEALKVDLEEAIESCPKEWDGGSTPKDAARLAELEEMLEALEACSEVEYTGAQT